MDEGHLKKLLHKFDIEYSQRGTGSLIEQEELGQTQQKEFIERFPLESLESLDLKTYTTGFSSDSFANWVEKRTKDYATIGGGPGQAAMLGVWSNQELAPKNQYLIKEGIRNKIISKQHAENLYKEIKKNLILLLKFAKEDRFGEIDELTTFWPIFKAKLVFLYFPEKLISVMSRNHIESICKYLNIEYRSSIISNHMILQHMRRFPEAKKWSSWKIGAFFYWNNELDLKGKNVMRYWAGAFHRGGTESHFDEFIENKYWKIWWGKREQRAKQFYKLINQMSIGDCIALKSYGGSHDLKIFAIGHIDDLANKDNGIVGVNWEGTSGLYNGKAPKGKGAGNWQGTLLEVKRKTDIEKLFDVNITPQKDYLKSNQPLNLIFYGPPGTGKTFHTKRRALQIVQYKDSDMINSVNNKISNPFYTQIKAYQDKGLQPPQSRYMGYFLFESAKNRNEIVEKTYSQMREVDGLVKNQSGRNITKEGLTTELSGTIHELKRGTHGIWSKYKLIESNSEIRIIKKDEVE